MHQSHQGIKRCIRRGREVVDWPRMSKDIEDFNSSCTVCKSYRPDQQKEPIISHEIPTGPWEKVACDLFDFERFVWTTTMTTSKFTEFMTRKEE